MRVKSAFYTSRFSIYFILMNGLVFSLSGCRKDEKVNNPEKYDVILVMG